MASMRLAAIPGPLGGVFHGLANAIAWLFVGD